LLLVTIVALSPCAVLSPSRLASWLLCDAHHCCPIWLHRPLVVLSCWLADACCVAIVALSCCATLSSSCHSCCLCRPIMLHHLLVLSARRLFVGPFVACCNVALSSCAALPSTHCAGACCVNSVALLSWRAALPCLGRPIISCCPLFLSLLMPPYHVAPHSCPLITSAGCCMCMSILSMGFLGGVDVDG
jgi:hypothetical protein